jgi:flagellin FlaB
MADINDRDRGQVGIGTLIVFIAMVLVAAIAAGVLINTAGFLQSSAEESGEQSASQVTNRLQVVTAVGSVVEDGTTTSSGDNEVTEVQLTVKRAPGADNIDLSTVTAQWVDDNGAFDVVINGESADANFAVTTFRDDDGSITDSDVLNDPADRAVLTFETQEDDDQDDTNSVVKTNLGPGTTATIKLNTQAGGETTATLVVPESLSGKSAIEL